MDIWCKITAKPKKMQIINNLFYMLDQSGPGITTACNAVGEEGGNCGTVSQ